MRLSTRTLIAPALLGFAGCIAITLAGPRLAGGAVRWWFEPGLGGAAKPLLYGGMLALTLAWGWMAVPVMRGAASPGALATVAALWSVPLLLGAPLFSHDLYSYLAQGTIAHLGRSPYTDPPSVLAALGHPGVLQAVSPFWRHTTAPYGPLFLGIVSVIVGWTGSHLVTAAMLVRLMNAAGLVLLAVSVPRLARRAGADPARAQWLVLLNPLLLLELLSPAHNDLLMAGLLASGILLGLGGRPLLGIAVCALAATIKVPALAGAIFLTVAWARATPGVWGRLRVAAAGLAVTAAVIALVSWVTGLGLGWISSATFSTPNRVHLAITPATALGYTLASVLHGAGLSVAARSLESALALAALAAVAAYALVRLWRVRFADLPLALGLVLLAFAFGGPAAWPWYLCWGIVLLAAAPAGRLWIAVAVLSVLGVFVVKADGILALPLQSAPAVLCLYLAAAALLVRSSRRGRRRAAEPERLERPPERPAAELAEIR